MFGTDHKASWKRDELKLSLPVPERRDVLGIAVAVLLFSAGLVHTLAPSNEPPDRSKTSQMTEDDKRVPNQWATMRYRARVDGHWPADLTGKALECANAFEQGSWPAANRVACAEAVRNDLRYRPLTQPTGTHPQARQWAIDYHEGRDALLGTDAWPVPKTSWTSLAGFLWFPLALGWVYYRRSRQSRPVLVEVRNSSLQIDRQRFQRNQIREVRYQHDHLEVHQVDGTVWTSRSVTSVPHDYLAWMTACHAPEQADEDQDRARAALASVRGQTSD